MKGQNYPISCSFKANFKNMQNVSDTLILYSLEKHNSKSLSA